MRTSPWCLLFNYASKEEDSPSSDQLAHKNCVPPLPTPLHGAHGLREPSLAPTKPAPLPDAFTLSHHLWAKATQLTQPPLSPLLTGTRCPVLSRAKPSRRVGTAGPPGCSHAPLRRRGQRAGGQPCPGRPWGQSTWGSALRQVVGEQHLPQGTWPDPTAAAVVGGRANLCLLPQPFLQAPDKVLSALAAPLNNSALLLEFFFFPHGW